MHLKFKVDPSWMNLMNLKRALPTTSRTPSERPLSLDHFWGAIYLGRAIFGGDILGAFSWTIQTSGPPCQYLNMHHSIPTTLAVFRAGTPGFSRSVGRRLVLTVSMISGGRTEPSVDRRGFGIDPFHLKRLDQRKRTGMRISRRKR